MSGYGDHANTERAELAIAAAVAEQVECVKRRPYIRGAPGVCDECGHYRQRLVFGVGAFCRDGRAPE